MSADPLKITGEDLAIIQETLRTGDLYIFTSRYMWLPQSGTMWLPGDDAVGNYRSTFRYDLLYDAWNKISRPDDQLTVTTAVYQYHLRVVLDSVEPTSATCFSIESSRSSGAAHRGCVVGQDGKPLSLEQHRAAGRVG